MSSQNAKKNKNFKFDEFEKSRLNTEIANFYLYDDMISTKLLRQSMN